MVLLLEVFNFPTGSVSHRVLAQTLFARFCGSLGPGIEDALLDALSAAEVTNGYFPEDPFQDDADLECCRRVVALTCRMKVLVT